MTQPGEPHDPVGLLGTEPGSCSVRDVVSRVSPRASNCTRSAASIFVIGAEGSGTTLVYSCIARHPDLAGHQTLIAPPRRGPLPERDAIVHLSLPTLRPMRWVAADDVPAGAKVILVRRSPLHTVFSAYRRFFRGRPGHAWRAYFRAIALEADYVRQHDPLCIFYEDLVHNSAKVLRSLYEFLEVESGFRPPINFRNRNDVRWKRDRSFVAFLPSNSSRRGSAADATAPARRNEPAVDAAFCCFGVTICIVDASGEDFIGALRELLPPDVAPAGEAPPDVTYRIERSPPRGSGQAGSYRIISEGRIGLRARRRERALSWLGGQIDRIVAESSRAGLFVHAGVVGWRGRAIVVPGRTMSGKSTLVAELVRLGATYYSDEFAVLDDAGWVRPYARLPMLRDASPVAIDCGATRPPLPIGLIVSTTYRPAVGWHPEELRGARAALPLVDNTITAREESARMARLAAKSVGKAVCLRGARPDATEVAPKLLAHLDRIIDGESSGNRRLEFVAERAIAILDAASTPAVVPEPMPPRLVRLDNFLADADITRLLDYAMAREAQFVASSVIGPDGTYGVNDGFRRSATLFQLGEIEESLTARLRRVLPYVRHELGMPWFLLDKLECQLAAHGDGGFFGCHIDDGNPDVAARRVTCVFYFHRTPKRFCGGELRLYQAVVRGEHREAGPNFLTVEPQHNTAVFFPSQTFHEVRPTIRDSSDFGDSRFSLTAWFWAGQEPSCLTLPASSPFTGDMNRGTQPESATEGLDGYSTSRRSAD